MKKIALLTTLFSLTSSLAFADGMPVVIPTKPCPPEPCACPKAFQGFYGGGNIGYGSAQMTHQEQIQLSGFGIVDSGKSKASVPGVDGGLILGYNYVFDCKMGLGLEAVFNWTSVNSTVNRTIDNVGVARKFGLNNSFEIRVPISYVIANLIAPKILLGWDASRWSGTVTRGDGLISGTKTKRLNGFLWGAGFDVLLTKHIISGFEYTGVLSQNMKFTDGQNAGSTFKARPLYNKVALTLKFIY